MKLLEISELMRLRSIYAEIFDVATVELFNQMQILPACACVYLQCTNVTHESRRHEAEHSMMHVMMVHDALKSTTRSKEPRQKSPPVAVTLRYSDDVIVL